MVPSLIWWLSQRSPQTKVLSSCSSHGNCQSLPVLLCFLNIIFGLGYLSTRRLDFFFFLSFFLQKMILCCLERGGSDNVIHNATRSGVEFLEFGSMKCPSFWHVLGNLTFLTLVPVHLGTWTLGFVKLCVFPELSCYEWSLFLKNIFIYF